MFSRKVFQVQNYTDCVARAAHVLFSAKRAPLGPLDNLVSQWNFKKFFTAHISTAPFPVAARQCSLQFTVIAGQRQAYKSAVKEAILGSVVQIPFERAEDFAANISREYDQSPLCPVSHLCAVVLQ